MIIYKVTNKSNGKIYIGQTTLTLSERRASHERESKNKYRKTVYFHNALLKYGFDSFEWCEIDSAETQEELDEKEIYWISYYNSTNKEKGYNLKSGGLGGGKNSKETLERIGASTKRKWETPEIAQKMLAGLRKGTETQKAKAENNWKTTTCINCGGIIKYRPKDTGGVVPKFCSDSCRQKFMDSSSKDNLVLANKKNQNKYNEVATRIVRWVSTWAINNLLLKDVSYNNLQTIFSELKSVTNVLDDRTIMKPFGFTSRKSFIKFLLKMYADQV